MAATLRKKSSKRPTKKPNLNRAEMVDLNTNQGRGWVEEFANSHDFREYMDTSCHFIDYLRKGVSPLVYDKLDLSRTDSGCLIIKNGIVFGLDELPDDEYSHNEYEEVLRQQDSDSSIAVLVPRQKKSKQGFLFDVVINGDIDPNEDWANTDHEVKLVTDLAEYNQPVLSFECLRRFYRDTAPYQDPIKRLAEGKIAIVDFTPEEFIDLTAKEEKLLKEKKKLAPPRSGFVLVHGRWHRTGTVLLYDKQKKRCMLLGRDEGTYFGCELPKPCKSIEEAFTVLMPPEVRKKGTIFERQGEWFMVPVDEKVVPAKADCVLLFEHSFDGSIFLPIETPDSNKHLLDTKDGRVSKQGKLYAFNPSLEHDQHNAIALDGWCTFYKNTALRSFSQEGVD